MNEHATRKRRAGTGLTLLAAACAVGGVANARETPQDGASHMLDEIVGNDAKMAAMMNRLIAEGGSLHVKRHVEIRIIRPDTELPVVSHVFDPLHAGSIQRLGYETAKAALGS